MAENPHAASVTAVLTITFPVAPIRAYAEEMHADRMAEHEFAPERNPVPPSVQQIEDELLNGWAAEAAELARQEFWKAKDHSTATFEVCRG